MSDDEEENGREVSAGNSGKTRSMCSETWLPRPSSTGRSRSRKGCNSSGVPHVLIGGLAVGLHGHPRATKDVDFMVGNEAFEKTIPLIVYREELAQLVAIAHTDIMSVPPGFPSLADEPSSADLPVISLPGLVLMKLDAFRPRDREDVRTLMLVHHDRLRDVRDHLAANAPDLVHRFAEALSGR